jgi:hypothetical protein
LTDLQEHFGPARPDAGQRGRRLASALAAPILALLVPDRGVPRLVAAGRFRLAMAIVVGAALLASAAVAIRLDVAPVVLAENAGAPPPPGAGPASGAPQGEVKTDREIEEEIEKRTALIRVKSALGAGLGTPLRILLLGVGLFLLGRYVGGKPGFERALAAASVGALPWAVRSVIAAAAIWRQDSVGPAEVDGIVSANPWSSIDNPVVARLLSGIDVFSLWSVVLCVFGLAAASGIGRVRSTIAVVIGFLLITLVSSVGAR